ncbi:MAG: D-alanine--D-alanine ligase [Clostridia bacterium]|nr:D-alanine--D-alanine ligase [Clostridia bacterium]
MNIAVLFGGKSSEHEVSRSSVCNVLRLLEDEKYNVTVIGITKEGAWYKTNASLEEIKSGAWEKRADNEPAWILPDSSVKGIRTASGKVIPIDVAAPILHGKNGEDGTISALFQLAGIPQITTSMTSAANSMDKALTKLICEKAGIPQADWCFFYRRELADMDAVVERAEKALDYPIFVKPASAGSSVGISKCHDREELINGLRLAAEHDFKIVLEETIVGHEVEVAVLGNDDLFASVVGEIAPAAEFYDYDAKYNDAASLLYIPARLEPKVAEQVREIAKNVFAAMECNGYARVDFFVKEDGSPVFNELNTIPGFTDISMYPKLMEASGIEGKALMAKLIDLAVEHNEGN